MLIKGGTVITVDPSLGDLFPTGDVLIEDGTIVEVARSIDAEDAELIDATDCLVLPGLVDTHRHTWQALFRNRACHVCRCVSTSPGRTRQSVASMSSASSASMLRATSTIVPSSIRTSPVGKRSPRLGSTVMTVPPLISIRLANDVSSFGHSAV